MAPVQNQPTVCFFDGDCGVCSWLADYATGIAPKGALQMRPNSDKDALPEGITEAITDRTIVVVTSDGRVLTRVLGAAAVAATLPGWRWVAPVMALPGIRHALAPVYDAFSARRHKISGLLGFRACRVPNARS